MSTAIWIATAAMCCVWLAIVIREIRFLDQAPAATKESK